MREDPFIPKNSTLEEATEEDNNDNNIDNTEVPSNPVNEEVLVEEKPVEDNSTESEHFEELNDEPEVKNDFEIVDF